MIAADRTTVAGHIEREHRNARMGALWILLTVAAFVVFGVALAVLWPPRELIERDASGMLDQGSRSSPQITTSIRGLSLS